MKKAILFTLPLVILCLSQAFAGQSLIANQRPADDKPYWGATAVPMPQVDWPKTTGVAKPDQNTILQGGDNFNDAFVIPALPFEDFGTTTGYTNDIEAPCGGTFGGPDVFYSYSPAIDQVINIHLCPTTFYAILYVYENSIDNLVGCSSFSLVCQPGPPSGSIDLLGVTAGNVYYIVVDGYYTSMGDYGIQVYEQPNVTCPPTAIPEGEPNCGDGYVDTYNSGCNDTTLDAFTSISIGDTICGTSGVFNGATNRDTDWYIVTITEQQLLTWSAVAEFPVQLFIFYAADCAEITPMALGYASGGDTLRISANCIAGTYYLFVSPQNFDPIYACPMEYLAWLNSSPSQPGPSNDNCADVSPLPLSPGSPLVFNGDNTWATMDCQSLGMPEVWAAFTLDVTADVTIDYCGTTPVFNTSFIVLVNSCPCGDYLLCNTYTQYACPNDDRNYVMIWNALPPGTYYYPILSMWDVAAGPYILNVSAVGYPELDVTPTQISGETDPGGSVSQTLTISNTGYSRDLVFDLFTVQSQTMALSDIAKNIDAPNCNFGAKKPAAESKTSPGILGGAPGQRIILQGGEDINTATPISALPYYDTGNTSGAFNDYEGTCGNIGGPDVVYSYVPPYDMSINVALCGSAFDTKLYIMEGSPDVVIACNDDFCGWQSQLPDVDITGGFTYYIVVDGFDSDSHGDYILNISENVPCNLTCPPEAGAEIEICGEDFNGGCNSDPNVFEPIGGNVTLCGTVWADPDIRDMDWYEFVISEPTYFSATGVAEFPLQMALVDAALGCPVTEVIRAFVADPCSTSGFSAALDPGAYWIIVAPYEWYNMPCDGSGDFGNDYIITTRSEPAWLLVDTAGGTVPSGGAPAVVNVTLDASQIGAGIYHGAIQILSNALVNNAVEIPVTFTVTSAGCAYTIGDINNNGAANGIDVVYGVVYFKGGPVPPVDCGGICPQPSPFYAAGDVNGSCVFNGIDITYFVGFLKGGQSLRICPSCPPAGTLGTAGTLNPVIAPSGSATARGAQKTGN